MISESNISNENARFLDTAVARGVFPSREAALNQAVKLLRTRQEVFDHFEQAARDLPSPLPSILEPQPGGMYAIRGHRITLHLVAEMYFSGMRDMGALMAQFPTVPADDLRQLNEYIEQHEQFLRAYHEANLRCREQWQSESRPPPSLDAMREKLKAMRAGQA